MVALSGKVVAHGNPPSSLHQVSQVELGDWMTEVEASLAAGGFAYIRSMLSELAAITAAQGQYGWVVSTSADAGIYLYQGIGWVRVAVLPLVMTESLAAQQAAASRDQALYSATLADGFQQQALGYATLADGFRQQAQASAALASSAAGATQAARSQVETIALASGAPVYATVSAGLSATPSGGIFYVVTPTGLDIYEDQSGVAVSRGSIDTLDSDGVDVRRFGAVAGSEASAVTTRAAIATAIAAANAAGGGIVLVPSGTWWINSPIVLNGSGVELRGVGGGAVIKAASGFSGSAMVSISGTRNQLINIGVDGNDITATPINGVVVGSAPSSGCVVENNRITRCSLSGIVVTDGGNATAAGPNTARDIVIRGNKVTDVGWVGIHVQGAISPIVELNSVASCGFHGIAVLYWCRNALIDRNFVSKATPPFYVYNGVGSLGGAEGGFLVARVAEAFDTRIVTNMLVDNRNAGQDGIGLGETAGVSHGRSIIDGNIVIYAGLFGIDGSASCTVTSNQIIQAAQTGIVLTLDLGGTIGPAVVDGNQVINCGGYAGITIAPPFTSGTLLHTDIVISDNVIADYNPTKVMQVGINIATAPGSTVRSMLITGNIAMEVGLRGFAYGGGGVLSNVFKSNNLFRGEPRGDIDLTLMNGWADASPSTPLQVYAAGEGTAVLSGAITGGTTTPGTVIAILPVGVRPRTYGTYPVATSASTVGFVAILPTGEITVAGGLSASVIALNGISYRIAP